MWFLPLVIAQRFTSTAERGQGHCVYGHLPKRDGHRTQAQSAAFVGPGSAPAPLMGKQVSSLGFLEGTLSPCLAGSGVGLMPGGRCRHLGHSTMSLLLPERRRPQPRWLRPSSLVSIPGLTQPSSWEVVLRLYRGRVGMRQNGSAF